IRHSNLHVFLLLFPGLPTRQDSFGDMLTGGACQHELRGGLIHIHGEVEILHRDFPRTTATLRSMRALLSRSPRPGMDIDFALVLGVKTFPINAFNLQEIVNSCHCGSSSSLTHTKTSRHTLLPTSLRSLCLPRLHCRMDRLPGTAT